MKSTPATVVRCRARSSGDDRRSEFALFALIQLLFHGIFVVVREKATPCVPKSLVVSAECLTLMLGVEWVHGAEELFEVANLQGIKVVGTHRLQPLKVVVTHRLQPARSRRRGASECLDATDSAKGWGARRLAGGVGRSWRVG